MTTLRTRRGMLLAGLALAAVSACAPTPVGLALDDRQQAETARAQAYLNGLASFQARFDQSGDFGVGDGWLWVDRPGRLRISYFGPKAQQMVANGKLFVVYNPANGATTTTPLSHTPLGLLLGDRISLGGTVVVTRFSDADGLLTLTLADTAHPNQGSLALALQRDPLLLTAVTATDIRGRSLTMALSDLRLHPVITPDLFRLPGNVLP